MTYSICGDILYALGAALCQQLDNVIIDAFSLSSYRIAVTGISHMGASLITVYLVAMQEMSSGVSWPKACGSKFGMRINNDANKNIHFQLPVWIVSRSPVSK